MAPPLRLPADAGVAELTQWLTEWSLFYPFASDDILKPVLRPAKGNFIAEDLEVILRWKAEQRWQKTAIAAIHAYDHRQPGSIQNKTGRALNADADSVALTALDGIPRVQGPAYGSAVLMALDPDRWTVFDIQASAALVCLRDLLRDRRNDPSDCLQELAELLVQFNPQQVNNQYPAAAGNWPIYVEICREISRMTMLSLRTIDRALYEARNWC